MNEPTWDHWQSFLATVDAGSLSAAARALGLTQPTLSRHIAALEAALGVPLFTRSPQGLTPTEAARALIPQARAMAAAAAALARTAEGAAGGGTVRLAAAEAMGIGLLAPVLAAFAAAHPGIAVELSLSDTTEDLLRREADIAVRMVRPAQGALIARRLGAVDLGLFADAGYLARAGTPATLADLAGHRLIGPDSDARLRGATFGGRPIGREDFILRCDHDAAQQALIRAGAGIGIAQVPVAAGLCRVLPDIALRLEVWLAMHADLSGARPVRALWDWLAAALPPVLTAATAPRA